MLTNTKLYKVIPNQVPLFWDAIKFAIIRADEVDNEYVPSYLVELLHSLLSSKAMCWVRLDENKQMLTMCITRIMADTQRDQKYLYVQGMYSWVPQPIDVWERDIDTLKEFAKKEGCSYLGCTARNPRVWEIITGCGFKEATRIFDLKVE